MRSQNRFVILALALALGGLGAGCDSDNSMTKAEIEAAKHAKPPTAEQLEAVHKSMAHAAESEQQRERDWVKAHPKEAAAINERRAKNGQKLMGQ